MVISTKIDRPLDVVEVGAGIGESEEIPAEDALGMMTVDPGGYTCRIGG